MADITFDTFSLSDSNFITSDLEYRTIPTRDIVLESMSRKSGKKILSEEFAERHIKLAGWIIGSDASDLITQIDNLHSNITRKRAGTLTIDNNRDIEAIVASVTITDPQYSQSAVPFQIEFIAAEPFWRGPEQVVSLTVTSGTSEPQTLSATITISGSIYAEPSISYNAPSGTGSTTTSGIQILYQPTGEFTTWSGNSNATLAYGNFVKFDYANQFIYEGATKIAPRGTFPRWEPGETNFTVTFSGSQQGGSLDFVYRPRYL